MTPGTYVQAPIRKVPLAFAPGKIVKHDSLHANQHGYVLVEMRHPRNTNNMYQFFHPSELIDTCAAIVNSNRP